MEEQETAKTDEKQNKPWLFKKGESGNPNGRPKGSVSVVEAIRRKLEEVNPESKRTYLEDLTEVLFGKAIKDKDVSMIKDIIDRVDGKALQKTDLTSGGDKIQPIYGGLSEGNKDGVLQRHNSNTQDIQSQEED